MNDHTLRDPELQSLEARLSAMALELSPAQQQKLLYQAAFAAGRNAARRTLRRWQSVSIVLILLLAGMTIPLASGPRMLAKQNLELSIPATEESLEVSTVQGRMPLKRQAAPVGLDAWQVPPTARRMVSFSEIDPHLRSLSVGALTRSLQEGH